MILILTRPNDYHAFFVDEALKRKGLQPVLWHTSDFPQLQTWTVEHEPAGVRWALGGPELECSEAPRVVWDRRPGPPQVSKEIEPADLRFAKNECGTFYRWLYLLLSEEGFWVNPTQASRRVASKVFQQAAARRFGLQTLPTLYSNDPREIRAFSRRHGEIVYKPFTQSGMWSLPGNRAATLYTARMTSELLEDAETLRATPGIYQPLAEKSSELRVTVIGEHVFPARIRSQEMERGKLDWRVDPLALPIEPAIIPEALDAAIRAFMKSLGLVFGCLDFIVTPDGEYLFLEVNDMGQFLFVEALTEIPLLDAFCELLIQGRPDFRWEPSAAAVRTKDLDPLIVARVQEAEARHIVPPDLFGIESTEGESREAPLAETPT